MRSCVLCCSRRLNNRRPRLVAEAAVTNVQRLQRGRVRPEKRAERSARGFLVAVSRGVSVREVERAHAGVLAQRVQQLRGGCDVAKEPDARQRQLRATRLDA